VSGSEDGTIRLWVSVEREREREREREGGRGGKREETRVD
jgi:hypothetical protein